MARIATSKGGLLMAVAVSLTFGTGAEVCLDEVLARE